MSQPAPHSQPVCVVVGAGTGLGASIALRFARAGYAVAICARRRESLEAISHDITHTLEQDAATRSTSSTAAAPDAGFVRAFSMDSSDEILVNAAFAEIKRQLPGVIRVLVYNAAQRKFKTENILEVSTKTFENFWRVNCFGALLCARQAVPSMLAAGPPGGDSNPLSARSLHSGTVLFTGASASLRCLAGLTSMSTGKFGLRALAQGIAREFGPKGIHVAHVIIDGAVDSPLLRSYVKGQIAKGKGAAFNSPGVPANTPFEARFLQPDAVAEEYFHLHSQHPSAWTQELDLRPHVEAIYSRM